MYSHSESGKDASKPLPFSEILMAEHGAEERIFRPAARTSAASRPSAKRGPTSTHGAAMASLASRMATAMGHVEDTAPQAGGLRRSLSLTTLMSRRNSGSASQFHIVLHTRERRIKLIAERESDARDWVDLFNAASRIGQGLGTEHVPAAKRENPNWPPDYSLLPRSMFDHEKLRPTLGWGDEKREPSKCSQEASTAEAASECGSASPVASSCAGEDGSGKEGPTIDDTESTSCSTTGLEPSSGVPSPASVSGSPANVLAETEPAEAEGEAAPPPPTAACQEAKPWETPPITQRPLQAADFGFDDEEDSLADEEEEENSPTASPGRHSTRAVSAPVAWAEESSEALLHTAGEQRGGASASAATATTTARTSVVEEHDGEDGSDDESPAHTQQASRVAADLQLVARALATRSRGGSGASTAASEKRTKRKKDKAAGKTSEERTAEAESAGRIAADLMLVQRAQAAAQRHGARAAKIRGNSVPAIKAL
eukprot:CAMPEP_0175442496 /NCGR_PEP_ID=MMETSP0095-20121207/58176_1 /TAXON_ID=311494 /ORGANISM="Alexandrium monilatum, Strain CCMP3105" /LENGTH=485 /DNA_ID=CAMNT_0016742523 /DNA_START=12 /DNA_END=1470 /DNA_ORIENTATION=+